MTRLGALAVVIAILAAIAAPFFLKPYGIFLISTWAVLTIAAIGLNLTLGYAGQISLAQGAFVGIGAYTVALLTPPGVPFFAGLCRRGAAVLRSRLGARLSGAARAAPLPRLRHARFHHARLPGAAQRAMADERHLRHHRHRRGRHSSAGDTNGARDFYFFCLGMLALLSVATWWMLRSPWGRAFVALRENPIRALSLGLDTRRYTLMAFAIGSSLGGLSGALYAPLVQFIEPNSFALGLSFNLLLMVIVGGSGILLRALRRRAGRGAAAGMAAHHARLLPHPLCRRGHGHDGVLSVGAARPGRACDQGFERPAIRRRGICAHGRCRTMTAVLEVSNLRKAFGGHHRGRWRVIRGPRRRDSRHYRTERLGQIDAVQLRARAIAAERRRSAHRRPSHDGCAAL